ncbi:hypothetical protein J3L12_15230 [Meiothermus sp. CFH 77666]|nr:hypothetical protein [Meiothermus sp. CFH 77666]
MNLEEMDKELREYIEREVQRRINKLATLTAFSILIALGLVYLMVAMNLSYYLFLAVFLPFALLVGWLAARIKKGHM